MSFEILMPLVKGFHLTLASHLLQHDKEGWKMMFWEWNSYLAHAIEEGGGLTLKEAQFAQ